jgi:hypothetical protein
MRTNLEEVVDTGTSLIVAHAQTHPSFHHSARVGALVRFFAGVPLVTKDGLAVGALCLADPRAQRCEAESVVILEQVGRRGTVTLSDPSEERTAPLLAQVTFEVLIDMEMRLARRHGETVELAILELPASTSPGTCAELLWKKDAGPRFGIGSLGPGRVGLCRRGAAQEVGPLVNSDIELGLEQAGASAAGVVSATGDYGLSEAALVRVAEHALDVGANAAAGARVGRIVLGPAAT